MKLAPHRSGARDRAVDLVDTVRPILTRAVHDPRIQEAVRHAVGTGREVAGELSGHGPGGAARRLINDHALRQRVSEVAGELREAAVQQAAAARAGRMRHWRRRITLVVLAVAGTATIVAIVMRRRGAEEAEEIAPAT